MKDIAARELKGHNILAVERFWDSTFWMIEFTVLRPTAYGSNTDSIPFRETAAVIPPERKGRDAMSVTEIENYRELILENIEYDCLKQRYPTPFAEGGTALLRCSSLRFFFLSVSLSFACPCRII